MHSSSSNPALPLAAGGDATADLLYVHLLKQVLTRFVAQEEFAEITYNKHSWQEKVFAPVKRVLAQKGYVMCKRVPFDADARTHGTDWPPSAETMAGAF